MIAAALERDRDRRELLRLAGQGTGDRRMREGELDGRRLADGVEARHVERAGGGQAPLGRVLHVGVVRGQDLAQERGAQARHVPHDPPGRVAGQIALLGPGVEDEARGTVTLDDHRPEEADEDHDPLCSAELRPSHGVDDVAIDLLPRERVADGQGLLAQVLDERHHRELVGVPLRQPLPKAARARGGARCPETRAVTAR